MSFDLPQGLSPFFSARIVITKLGCLFTYSYDVHCLVKILSDAQHLNNPRLTLTKLFFKLFNPTIPTQFLACSFLCYKTGCAHTPLLFASKLFHFAFYVQSAPIFFLPHQIGHISPLLHHQQFWRLGFAKQNCCRLPFLFYLFKFT